MKHALVLALLLAAPAARAADLPCGPAEKGTIELDGLLDDWKDVDGIDAGGRDANFSLTVKCNVDANALWLMVDVRDNYFARTKAARPGEDHLALTLGGKTMQIFPGDQGQLKDKVVPSLPGMKIGAALQPKGWAVEIGVPLKSIPGWRSGAPTISYKLAGYDCDAKSRLKTERTVDTSGRILFAEGEGALEAFLKERALKRGDVWFDRALAIDRRSGARLLFAGRYMAAISDGYVYQELPFHDRKDLKDARLLDLAGDGRGALVLQYVERAQAGNRDVLAVFRFGSDAVRRVFAAETGKSQGANQLASKVTFVKRGAATDIVIEPTPAVGFTRESYRESPAEDMIPVMVPWGDDRCSTSGSAAATRRDTCRARYQFRGDEYLRQ